MQGWLLEAGIDCIEWPPYSPDLNPIENLWAELKNRVEKHNTTNTKELTSAVQAEWKAIELEKCQRLINSIPHRLAIVLAARGGYTEY